MRFCLVSTQENWGGGESLLRSIADQLTQSGHRTGWVVRGDSQVAEQVEAGGGWVMHALRGRGSNLRDWRISRRLVRNWAPDVIILNDTHAVPLFGSATLFCPVPRPLRLAYKHTVFPLRSSLKYRFLCDKVVCVSKSARDTVVRGGLPAEHAMVVHGGCLPPENQVDSHVGYLADSLAVRRELGLRPGQKLLLAVGSLLDCKGHPELLQAVADLDASAGDLLVAIAGEGPLRAHLEKRIEAQGLQRRVRLLGYREDVLQLMAAADLIVHPSHAEGLSLVLIQAQMLCKPIVATAVGGAAEVLHAEQPEVCTSFIAEPKNTQSLAAQIKTALSTINQSPKELAVKLRATSERTRAEFDIRQCTRKLVDACDRLLQQKVK